MSMRKTQMDHILSRLRWSMLENNNEWVSASEMMWLLKEHTKPQTNALYREACSNRKIPVPTFRYLNNQNQLAHNVIRSGEYEVIKSRVIPDSPTVNMYRLKEVTA